MKEFIENITNVLLALQVIGLVVISIFGWYMRTAFVSRGDFNAAMANSASRDDLKKLESADTDAGTRLTTQSARLQELAGKVARVEDRVAILPNAEAVKDLELAMERLSGDVRVLGQKLEGFDDLQEMLRGQVDRMDEFLRKTK